MFQSTLPVKGATPVPPTMLIASDVSIHAPREGSDVTDEDWDTSHHGFNPRSP